MTNSSTILYYTLFTYGDLSFYLAATRKGLCFVGKNPANLEELKLWALKHVEPYQLRPNDQIMEKYTLPFIRYFKGKHVDWTTTEIDLYGTAFQKRVWHTLAAIDYGETTTYDTVAKHLAPPSSARAVGGALNKNPLMVIIPCHRVLAKSGKLTGFRGGIEMKKTLLSLESKLTKE